MVSIGIIFVWNRNYLIGLDSLHIEVVRDNSRPGLELFQLGNQFYVQARQQIESDYICLAEVQRENILLLDFYEVCDIIFFDIFERLFHSFWGYIVADSQAAEFLSRCNHDSTVAATEDRKSVV